MMNYCIISCIVIIHVVSDLVICIAHQPDPFSEGLLGEVNCTKIFTILGCEKFQIWPHIFSQI